ncbi:MAG: sigma-70 family RNA polymerase sigma factor [Lachnospiraceae bacterium]
MDTGYNLEEFFKRYSDMVYRIAVSYSNDVQMAEDIVQEVFLRFLKKKPGFKNNEHEKAWFIRVTINCCKSFLSSAWVK